MKKMLVSGLFVLALFLTIEALLHASPSGQTPPTHLAQQSLLPSHITRSNQLSLAAVEQQKDECPPLQHKNANGECVDDPNVIHYHGSHNPLPGETCYAECLCYEGQYPINDNCSPCSYVGVVCKRS